MLTNRLLILGLSMFALLGCGRDGAPRGQALPSATTLPPPTLADSETPVILIYQAGGFSDPQVLTERVRTAVWSDGRIVWSADGSLREARIDPRQIDGLLQRLHRDGVFGDGDVYQAHFGPDSTYDVIDVRLPDRRLQLLSWHEGFEQNPKLVVTSKGVESLEGRDRDAVLAAEPAEYQRFRQVWSDIRSAVDSWRPARGGPFAGSVAAPDGG